MDYLAKYYDVHFDMPDHDNPDFTQTRWTFSTPSEDGDDVDEDEFDDTFDKQPKSWSRPGSPRSHSGSISSEQHRQRLLQRQGHSPTHTAGAKPRSPGDKAQLEYKTVDDVDPASESGTAAEDRFPNFALGQISSQLSSLKEGDTLNMLFQEQQEERDRYVRSRQAPHNNNADSSQQQQPLQLQHPQHLQSSHQMQRRPRSHHESKEETHVKKKRATLQIRFKRDKRAGSKANADISIDDYV